MGQSPTTLLRGLWQWSQMFDGGNVPTIEKDQVARCMSSTFSLPFFKSSTADLKEQASYHTLFSGQFLLNEGLIDSQGTPTGISNFVTHLFEIEPANFIIGRLLTSGLLHKFVKKAIDDKKPERQTHPTVRLAGILAWFMFRKRLPVMRPKDRVKRKKHLPSMHCPALAPLPADILAEVKAYNHRTFDLFQEFCYCVSSTRKLSLDHDYTLPLSKLQFLESWKKEGQPFNEASEFQKLWIQKLHKFRARVPLAAIAGKGDTFSTVQELLLNSRNVLHLDINTLPVVPEITPGDPLISEDESQQLESTNSWIVDFLMHGKFKYLAEDNGINNTKAFKEISKFKDAVGMAIKMFKVYAPKEDIVLKTFEELKDELESRLHSGAK